MGNLVCWAVLHRVLRYLFRSSDANTLPRGPLHQGVKEVFQDADESAFLAQLVWWHDMGQTPDPKGEESCSLCARRS